MNTGTGQAQQPPAHSRRRRGAVSLVDLTDVTNDDDVEAPPIKRVRNRNRKAAGYIVASAASVQVLSAATHVH